MSFLTWYFRLNKFRLFLAIVFLNMLVMWLSKSVLINETVFYNTFSEQLSYDRSMELFQGLRKVSWIGYVFLPIILMLKFSLISVIIYTGIFFCEFQDRVSFRVVFGTVVVCEIVFLSASILKFLWFIFFAGNFDLYDINFFYPLSLGNLFKPDEVDNIWIHPLQLFNLFQIIYIWLISFGLSSQTNTQKSVIDKAILISYLPGLFVWVALIMFLSLG
jgi:hypothetical protein